MDAAWRDHQQGHQESFQVAEQETELLALHPELLVH
jgi:hypothetical protein